MALFEPLLNSCLEDSEGSETLQCRQLSSQLLTIEHCFKTSSSDLFDGCSRWCIFVAVLLNLSVGMCTGSLSSGRLFSKQFYGIFWPRKNMVFIVGGPNCDWGGLVRAFGHLSRLFWHLGGEWRGTECRRSNSNFECHFERHLQVRLAKTAFELRFRLLWQHQGKPERPCRVLLQPRRAPLRTEAASSGVFGGRAVLEEKLLPAPAKPSSLEWSIWALQRGRAGLRGRLERPSDAEQARGWKH